MKKTIKKILFGDGVTLRKILFGKAKGIKMYIDAGNKTQRILGTDENEIQSCFVDFSKKCNHFFDIGASDGYYGLFYKKYNPKGQAYLFDSDVRFEKIQKEHFQLNSINEGVHSYYKYVSNVNDDTNITVDSFNLKDENIFLKIDVDGAELIVLEGIQKTLKTNNCFLIVETHSAQLEKDCQLFLEKLGYKFRVIDNAWWRIMLPERRPIAHNRWFESYK